MKIDYLIIGQGLAGSLLGWELIQRQKKVLIVDNNQLNASLVAAGLINPVTGMRFVKSANIDQLLPCAVNYYQKLAHFFNQAFYVEKPMLRILRNTKELSACQKRLNTSEYSPYLSEIASSFPNIENKFGILKQRKTAYLLTVPLLSALKDYFITHQAYISADLHYDEIKLSSSLQWKDIKPKHIIFCEGHHATNNPWFSNLPFQLVKGEIVTATASQKIPQYILNYGNWFIPLDQTSFRTGASFDRHNLNTTISSLAKEQLFESLKLVYPSLQIEKIVNQQAGIRPTTQDKLPFIGQHPIHHQLFIFNGFGSKGSLQIPWHCQKFVDYLLNNNPLPQPSNIQRYHSLFKND